MKTFFASTALIALLAVAGCQTPDRNDSGDIGETPSGGIVEGQAPE